MSRRRRRRRPAPSNAGPDQGFWGESRKRAPAPNPINPTPDPAALPRSLGNPPFTVATAADQLAVVYEEAVRAATALAAANGLLAEE
jgi:hypothetical protein